MAEEEKPKESFAILILKYFAHGVLFSLLAVGLIFAAGFILLFLAILGLGGILLILAMLYVIPLFFGVANCVITGYLWFPVKYSWLGTWVHGILLLIALIIEGLIIALPLSVIPSIEAIIIVGLIISAFIDGYIGKKIAEIWRKETAKSFAYTS